MGTGLTGKIVQVNVSSGGIPKLPLADGAWISERGLEGDACRNLKVHGGPLKAVLLLSTADLAEIRGMGYDVEPGTLGENLTVDKLSFALLQPGQRLRAGGAVLQITRARKPCRTLDPLGPGIQKAVMGRGGYYARVIQPGHVKLGDEIRLEP